MTHDWLPCGSVLATQLSGLETTSGSVHYSVDHPVLDDLLRRIVELRRAEIDARAGVGDPS